jgi:hypothetical protein
MLRRNTVASDQLLEVLEKLLNIVRDEKNKVYPPGPMAIQTSLVFENRKIPGSSSGRRPGSAKPFLCLELPSSSQKRFVTRSSLPLNGSRT